MIPNQNLSEWEDIKELLLMSVANIYAFYFHYYYSLVEVFSRSFSKKNFIGTWVIFYYKIGMGEILTMA